MISHIKRKGWTTIVFIMGIMMPTMAAAAEEKTTNLEEIVVTGETLFAPTKETDETVYTGTEVTKEGIESEGTKAKTSVYEAIDILPGIIVESAGGYGLAAEQTTIRVRGIRGYLGSMTMEGVPNYGGNPIGPRQYIYDTENFQSISVYKGAVPSDLGTGVGDRGGAIELKQQWPTEEFGFRISQGVGTDGYHRTFLRIDSGSLTDWDTRLS
ncbi:TonB-dependent receptor plug domain protein, partial [delta proteobacterium NaphS2]